MKTTNETRKAVGTVPAHPESLRDVSLRGLFSETTRLLRLLVTTEVALARAEIRSDVRSGIAMATGLGIAAVCAFAGFSLLLVAAVLALAAIVPGWAAALIVGALLIVLGGVMGAIGWARRPRKPLEASRASLKEDLEWMRNRLA